MPTLSVVIPTYNRKASLLRTLRSLAQQTTPSTAFEVIVVSDGSTDGTVETLAEYSRIAPYHLRFFQQDNSGPSWARNRGIEESGCDVVVFLDDDVDPVPEFLERHAAHHQHDEHIVVLGPMSPDLERRPAEPVWIAWEHAKLQEIYGVFRPGGRYHGSEPGPSHFYSGNASIRRRWLLEVGGYDLRYRRQEDVELATRLEQHCGVTFCFDFLADGIHRPERTFGSWLNIPTSYGAADAQRIEEGNLQVRTVHYHLNRRNPFTRLLSTALTRCPLLVQPTTTILGNAASMLYRAGLRAPALAALSGLYNALYVTSFQRNLKRQDVTV